MCVLGCGGMLCFAGVVRCTFFSLGCCGKVCFGVELCEILRMWSVI